MGVTLAPLWNPCSAVPIGIRWPHWGIESPAFDWCDVIRERKKSKLLTQKGTQYNSSHSGFSRTHFIILIPAFLGEGLHLIIDLIRIYMLNIL